MYLERFVRVNKFFISCSLIGPFAIFQLLFTKKGNTRKSDFLMPNMPKKGILFRLLFGLLSTPWTVDTKGFVYNHRYTYPNEKGKPTHLGILTWTCTTVRMGTLNFGKLNPLKIKIMRWFCWHLDRRILGAGLGKMKKRSRSLDRLNLTLLNIIIKRCFAYFRCFHDFRNAVLFTIVHLQR